MNNRNWLWFFAVLIVLTITAMAINYWYATTHQLTAAQLHAAQALWQEKGPADYDLKIRKELSSAAGGVPEREEIDVNVRGGKVLKVTLNGRELEERLRPKYDIPAWFDYLNEFMERDTKPGAAQVFCDATFDARDGHPIRYRRRVNRTSERADLQFDLHRVGERRPESKQP